MESRLHRIVGAFTVFFTLTLPLFAALIATAVYPRLTELVSRKGFSDGGIAEFYFENFRVAIALPVILGVVGAGVAFVVWRKGKEDGVMTLSRLLVIQTLTCFLTFLWFAAYVVAAVKGQ